MPNATTPPFLFCGCDDCMQNLWRLAYDNEPDTCTPEVLRSVNQWLSTNINKEVVK